MKYIRRNFAYQALSHTWAWNYDWEKHTPRLADGTEWEWVEFTEQSKSGICVYEIPKKDILIHFKDGDKLLSKVPTKQITKMVYDMGKLYDKTVRGYERDNK